MIETKTGRSPSRRDTGAQNARETRESSVGLLRPDANADWLRRQLNQTIANIKHTTQWESLDK